MASTTAARQILEAVRDLAPAICARAEEIEAARRIPSDLDAQLRAAGLYRMLLPHSHGGEGVALLDVLEIVELLSIADGSVGWTATIGIQSPSVLSLLPRETFDAVYANGPDVTIGGAINAQGEAHVVDGGYRVSGKWAFASGCHNWEYLFGTCVLLEDGEPVPGPAPGQPATRAMMFRADETEILDTWRALGLRGTGSHHIAVADVFVPEARTLDFLFGTPCVPGIYRFPIIEFYYHIASIAIGLAQGALDEALAAAGRQRFMERTTIAAAPVVQNRLGRAAIALRAARGFLRREAERLASDAEREFLPAMIDATAVNAWIGATCVDVVETCYRVDGARSVQDGAPLQRRLRDIHTICQHAAFNEGALTRAGAALLGQDVGPLL
jgi:alkylation response protein AidB-like acyl-CoA dehydrogenase